MLAMSKKACSNFQTCWSVCREILWLLLKQKNGIFPATAWARKVALLCWTCTTCWFLTPDWPCKESALGFCPSAKRKDHHHLNTKPNTKPKAGSLNQRQSEFTFRNVHVTVMKLKNLPSHKTEAPKLKKNKLFSVNFVMIQNIKYLFCASPYYQHHLHSKEMQNDITAETGEVRSLTVWILSLYFAYPSKFKAYQSIGKTQVFLITK